MDRLIDWDNQRAFLAVLVIQSTGRVTRKRTRPCATLSTSPGFSGTGQVRHLAKIVHTVVA
jgi:hypothetical protein